MVLFTPDCCMPDKVLRWKWDKRACFLYVDNQLESFYFATSTYQKQERTPNKRLHQCMMLSAAAAATTARCSLDTDC